MSKETEKWVIKYTDAHEKDCEFSCDHLSDVKEIVDMLRSTGCTKINIVLPGIYKKSE